MPTLVKIQYYMDTLVISIGIIKHITINYLGSYYNNGETVF